MPSEGLERFQVLIPPAGDAPLPPLFGSKPRRKKREKKKKKAKSSGLLNSIQFVTGPLGCGKSYFGQKSLMNYGAAGKVVACNFELTGDWWNTMRRMSPDGKKLEGEDARAWTEECRERVYLFDQMSDLYDYQLPGSGEDRGLLVFDEGGLNMNRRLSRHRAKEDELEHNNPIASLQFFINMRKRGWTCLVLAHSAKHLDDMVQDMGGSVIHLRNFARIKMPLVGISLAKNPRFLAMHFTPEISRTKPTKRELYGLKKHIARHYKSEREFEYAPESRGLRLQQPPGPLGRLIAASDQTHDPRSGRATPAAPPAAERGRSAGGAAPVPEVVGLADWFDSPPKEAGS